MPDNRPVSRAALPSNSKFSHSNIRAGSEALLTSHGKSEYHVITKASSAADIPKSLVTGLLSPPDSDDDEAKIKKIPKRDAHLHTPPVSPTTVVEEPSQFRKLGVEHDHVSPFASIPYRSRKSTKQISSTGGQLSDDSFPFPVQTSPVHGFEPSGIASRQETPKNKFRYLSTGSSYSSPSTPPDRYISNRNSPQALSETFRSSKLPNVLSGPERLLRENSYTPDPFGPISPQRVRQRRQQLSFDRPRNRNEVRLSAANSVSVVNVSTNSIQIQSRLASTGSVWNIGGGLATSPQGPIRSISDGRGGLIGSGTNAPLYTANFSERKVSVKNDGFHEGRLAVALDIDQNTRLLNMSHSPASRRSASTPTKSKFGISITEPRTKWVGGGWVREGSPSLLDAPRLRDDYYCSVLAYCHTSRTLAVGLGNRVYLWSEAYGVQFPHMEESLDHSTYVTSLSFSSTQGGHSILAIGRHDGRISLWSLYDSDGIRFQHKHSKSISCVAFKPVTTERESMRFGSLTPMEELLVGDGAGMVSYYFVEWMSNHQVDIHGWPGEMVLMARIKVHNQQICGLAWSQDGDHFATGGNDNGCCLFDVKDIFKDLRKEPMQPSMKVSDSLHSVLGLATSPLTQLIMRNSDPSTHFSQRLNHQITSTISHISRRPTGQERYKTIDIVEGGQKHKWIHSAAIKAIAFCPWQSGLLATGGGSNDRAIHFYHTISGACLATIDVQAQVTSLIWSTSRREIAATFGYAQPEHPYRIAVFSWPECKQVVAIPWAPDMRALLAVAYPGGPNEASHQVREGKTWWSRTAEEGCIVVASSDESVKFHEVWSGIRKPTTGGMGLLGGSDILEALEGIEKEKGGVIR